MKRVLRPRQHIYDLYWYFAAERQAIFNRRVAGMVPPWTSDPIPLFSPPKWQINDQLPS